MLAVLLVLGTVGGFYVGQLLADIQHGYTDDRKLHEQTIKS